MEGSDPPEPPLDFGYTFSTPVFLQLLHSYHEDWSTHCFFSGQYAYTPEVQNDLEIRTSECPIAFHQIGGKCYFYGYFKLNWFRAMEFCHSFGESVSLACIETPEENEHLKNWLISNGK